MMAGAGVSVGGGAGMLRTRRRDVSVKPNRKLDRKSSRGMIYENEELRLRTIHINAEVEQGQNDIKKLRRENEQLRREIWSLRDEYDKLEEILKRQKTRGESEEYEDRSEEDDGLQSDYTCEEDEILDEEEEEEEDEEEEEEEEASEEGGGGTSKVLNQEEQLENAENQKISSEKMTSLHRLHVDFDDLSVVDEEEELKKDKERKEATSEEQLKGGDSRNPPAILRPRQLHENIPFYPATYEPPNTFSSPGYYECPFEFPNTLDLMLPADVPALLAPPYSSLQTDPLIPVASFEQVGDQMLPRIHPPPVGWQNTVAVPPPSQHLSTYQSTNLAAPSVSASPDIQIFSGTGSTRARRDNQRFGLPMGTRNAGSNEPVNFFDPNNPFQGSAPSQRPDEAIVENGWCYASPSSDPSVSNEHARIDASRGRSEGKSLDGIFTFGGSEKPKHFFAPLASRLKRHQADEGSPTTSSSYFGTGTSSSSGRTGSTVVSRSQFGLASPKGSVDICVSGAIPSRDNFQGIKEEQRTFLSTGNLLIGEDKSDTAGSNQLTKSMSCQDLTTSDALHGPSQSSKSNHINGVDGQRLLAQSENTLDNLPKDSSSKPFKTHLQVTLKMPSANQTGASGTPEIPKLPSMDYRLAKNPFLRSFDQTTRNYTDEASLITRPLSVQVSDDIGCYRHPTTANVAAYKQRGGLLEDRYGTIQGHLDPNRLLIPSNQLVPGKSKNHDIEVTSFERPSPHNLIPTYDLNSLGRLSANQYLQGRGLYRNVPFAPRGPNSGRLVYPQRGAMRMYYDDSTLKVPAQTQTSIDGDSRQGEDQVQSREDESVSVPSSPACGQQRKRIEKRKEKTAGVAKDQKPLSPAAQRRLKKQSSVASSEAPDSPGKLARKRPRKLSVTTTTASEGQEDKNESRSSSSGQDSPRKDQTRRVSLYFNTKKRPSLTSIKTARSGSLDVAKDKYADGVTNSERERTNSISSRETSSAKPRKTSTSSGSVPWCACWGNGCI